LVSALIYPLLGEEVTFGGARDYVQMHGVSLAEFGSMGAEFLLKF